MNLALLIDDTVNLNWHVNFGGGNKMLCEVWHMVVQASAEHCWQNISIHGQKHFQI